MGSDCTLWTGARANGYGWIALGHRGDGIYAHRAAWTHLHGEIPAGHDVHHSCGQKLCINPDHLVLMTHSSHMRTVKQHITHCPHGHPYDTANTIVNNRGHRQCRECKNSRARAAYHRRRVPADGPD